MEKKEMFTKKIFFSIAHQDNEFFADLKYV